MSDDYVMIGKFITAAKHPQFGKHQIAPFAVAAIISITAGFRIQFDVSNQIPIGIYPIIFIFQGYGTVVFAVTGFNTGKGRKFHITVAVKPFHPRIQITSGQIVIPACRQGIIFHILGVYAV